MKSKMTIGRKLGLSFGVIVALLLVLSGSSLNTVGKLRTALEVDSAQSARKFELAGIINTAESDMAATERGMILLAVTKDTAGMAALDQDFQADVDELKRATREFRSLAKLAESRALCESLDRQVEEWKANFAQVSGLLHAGSMDEGARMSRR